MIIESGIIVALGLIFTFLKCSWRTRLKMLSNPIAMDLGIFTVLTILHWGTFYGVMAATCGAMICSGLISIGRHLYGYIDTKTNTYYRGLFNVIRKLQ